MRNVAVIGAGVMGRRIAYGCIIKGLQTRIFDISNEASAAALDVIKGYMEERESEGRLPRGTLEVNYVTNRIWRAVKKEALSLIDKGHSTAWDIDRGWKLE